MSRPAARRRSGIRPSRNWSARSAAPNRRTRSIARSARSPSASCRCGCCVDAGSRSRLAANSAAACSARAARRSWSTTRRASGRTASSADRRRWSPTKTSSRRFVPKACCRSGSIATACATTFAAGGAASGSRRAGSRRRRSSTPSRASTFRTGRSTRSAHCPWDAEAGYYYYVNVEGRDSKGTRVVRQERRVRWEAASGVVDHTFDDELVPGTTGRRRRICLRQVEPFPTGEIVPYDTAFLSGHVVEHYQVALTEAAGDSEAQMRATLEQLCAQQVPGDTHRNLVIHPVFSGRTFKHVLVPIWLLVYMFGSQVLPGRGQRLHRPHRRPLSVQPVEDRVPDPARDHRALPVRARERELVAAVFSIITTSWPSIRSAGGALDRSFTHCTSFAPSPSDGSSR